MNSEAGRHIAIVAPPTPGHVNPLLALGTALVERGHRVTVVHLGDAARLVRGTSVQFAALGGPRDRPGLLDAYLAKLARPTGPIGLVRMIKATAAITDRLFDALPSALERIGADAVIADSAEAAGALAARRLGLPFVTSVTGLPLLAEPGVPPPFVGWNYRDDEVGLRRNAGGYAVTDWLMRPIKRVLDRHGGQWGLDPSADGGFSPLLQVSQCPQGLDFPRRALPAAFRYGSPWRLPPPPDPLSPDDGRPLVFCSLGTLQGSRKALFAAMTRACAMIGARAVVAHGGGLSDEEAVSLPGDPLVHPFWPQTAILPRCAAAVLHGGFNSVVDALAAGVPVVAVPIAFEQPATAARLAWAGAGRVVTPARCNAATLSRALAAVTGDSAYRAAARRIGSKIDASEGAARAAALVDAAFSSGRTPPV